MSKAFTRESDDAPDMPAFSRPVSPLPPGAKNYITVGGERQLRQALDQLLNRQRPKLAAVTADADARAQLQALDSQVQQLQYTLSTATVAPPPPLPWDRVLFGATVTVRERSGQETRYRIVGVDETDIDRDWVSWISPIAKALLNARLGQKVKFKFPSGQAEFEIIAIAYE